MTTWSAAVLVGGRARRLGGRAKPLLDVGGRTVVERQAAAVTALGGTVTLVAAQDAAPADWPYPVVRDLMAGGALAGLHAALTHAATPYVLVLAGDLPFLTVPFLAALLERRHAAEAVVPRPAGRWQPLCAVYQRTVAGKAQARLARGLWRVTDLLDDLRVEAVDDVALAPFDPHGRLLLNVNTPDDYQRAVLHAVQES
ncbi:MAG: molybdenum cofactor guanylyltransferase [Vicinamibacterales bacterium]